MIEAQAFWTIAPGVGEIRACHLPALQPGEVLVRSSMGAVSRGTECLVFQGRVPEALIDVMRCPFQEGMFPGPVKYGYCVVGVVEEGSSALIGRRVFVLHPHQDRFIVPAKACHLIPNDVPTDRAVLAPSMETALNALWDGGALPGQHIAIVGAGTIGCLIAALVGQLPGAEVTLIDTLPARAAVADALSVSFALPHCAPSGCDIVFHTSATAEGLTLCLGIAGAEATIIDLSWYGDRSVMLPLGGRFHSSRLRLIASQVSQIAPIQRPRWTHRRRLDLALRLLADARLDVLFDGESPFIHLPSTLPHLLSTPALCHRVRY